MAETNGLLNRRTGKSGTEGSNPSVSAKILILKCFSPLVAPPKIGKSLETVGTVPAFVPTLCLPQLGALLLIGCQVG